MNLSDFKDSDIRVCRNRECRRYGIFVFRINGKRCSECGGKLKGPNWGMRLANDAPPVIDGADDPGPIPLGPSNVVAFPAPTAPAAEDGGNGKAPIKLIIPTRDAWRTEGGDYELYNDLLRANGIQTFVESPLNWMKYDEYLAGKGAGLMTSSAEIKALIARVKADVDSRPPSADDIAKAARCSCPCTDCTAAIAAQKPKDHCGTARCPMPYKGTYVTNTTPVKVKGSDTFTADEGKDAAPACVTGCPIAAKADVEMPHEMFRTCIYLAHKLSTEWIAYIHGVFDPAKKRFILTDMYFPRQIATAAHVKVDDDDMEKPEQKEVQAGTIAAIHSHVAMDAFFSAEDQKHFNHPVELVINRSGKIVAAVDVTLECGRHARVEANIWLSGTERQQAIEADLRSKLSTYNYNRRNRRQNDWEDRPPYMGFDCAD